MFGSRSAKGSSGILTALGVLAVLVTLAAASCRAGWFDSWFGGKKCDHPGGCCTGPGCPSDYNWVGEPGGNWYWLRSPEEERKAIIGLYNRYCIRCHGVDGRGIWDIPGVPDFTNPRFHACRSDGMLVRSILEGRGAVMPPFRGTLTLEESWGMARYLRTFLPGTETSKPDAGNSDKEPLRMPKAEPDKKPETAPPGKDKKEG
jgi:hypothetical protein